MKVVWCLDQSTFPQQIRNHFDLLLQDCFLNTGRLDHWLTIEGQVTETYDVVFLPGIRKPYTPGFREPEQHQWRMHLPPGPWQAQPKPPADFEGWTPQPRTRTQNPAA